MQINHASHYWIIGFIFCSFPSILVCFCSNVLDTTTFINNTEVDNTSMAFYHTSLIIIADVTLPAMTSKNRWKKMLKSLYCIANDFFLVVYKACLIHHFPQKKTLVQSQDYDRYYSFLWCVISLSYCHLIMDFPLRIFLGVFLWFTFFHIQKCLISIEFYRREHIILLDGNCLKFQFYTH